MFRRLVRMIRLKSLFPLFGFVILAVTFYYALMDALHKHKNNPIVIPVNHVKLTPEEARMKALYEKSLIWSSQSKVDKMKNLLENPIYANYNIAKPEKKKKVTILLIISSGPRRSDRRNAIRETWWKHCKPTHGINPECIFFTDLQKPNDKYYEKITEESRRYKDLYFQPLRGGIEFGIRFLYQLIWAMVHYEFDYYVRADDDYFFCLERFLYELPMPMLKRFHWGFTHCIREIVRPEESMILLSRDLIEYFLSQNPQTMRCHPWADQMLGVWTTDLGTNNLYRHDYRLHHAPVVDQAPELRSVKNICDRYIGIHGTYPQDMKLFWNNRGQSITKFKSNKERRKKLGNLETNSEVCELVHNFNYLIFEPEWQYEPQRCIYDPIWDTKKQSVIGGVYSGRQDDKRLSGQDLKSGEKHINGGLQANLDKHEGVAYHDLKMAEKSLVEYPPQKDTKKTVVKSKKKVHTSRKQGKKQVPKDKRNIKSETRRDRKKQLSQKKAKKRRKKNRTKEKTH